MPDTGGIIAEPSRPDHGVPAVKSGERSSENTLGRHGGRGHVLLHRGCNRVYQMDRQAQVQYVCSTARELCLQVLRREGHFTTKKAHRQQVRGFRGEA